VLRRYPFRILWLGEMESAEGLSLPRSEIGNVVRLVRLGILVGRLGGGV